MSDNKNKKNWHDKPWAGRAAKDAEAYIPTGGSGKWKKLRRQFDKDPDKFMAETADEEKKWHDALDISIKDGSVMLLADSPDPAVRKLQERMNALAGAAGIDIPALYLHTDEADIWPGYDGVGAHVAAFGPHHILMNEKALEKFLNDKRERYFPVVMSHELAHIINGDVDTHQYTMAAISPPSNKLELLADRLGAILHGNPREYAEVTAQFLGAGRFKARFYNDYYPSVNETARMVHKWADMLESEGAADLSTGKITDRSKAMAIFERSKSLTSSLANIDSFSRM